MFLFDWMTNKLPRFKLVEVAVVAVAVILTALGAMMTLGQQVYATNNNQGDNDNVTRAIMITIRAIMITTMTETAHQVRFQMKMEDV